MTLFEKVKTELANVTQDQVSQLLIDLNLSEDQILADDTLVLNFITRLSKLQGNLTTKSENKLKPKPTMTKTDSNIQPIQPTNKGVKAIETVQTASDRREVATASMFTAGQDAVSLVLEKAQEKANAKLAAETDELSTRLSEQLYNAQLKEITDAVGFFERFLTQESVNIMGVISPNQVVQGELV